MLVLWCCVHGVPGCHKQSPVPNSLAMVDALLPGDDMLAIDIEARSERKGLRRGEAHLDSLAYIDGITAEEQRLAEDLIKEQAKLSQ